MSEGFCRMITNPRAFKENRHGSLGWQPKNIWMILVAKNTFVIILKYFLFNSDEYFKYFLYNMYSNVNIKFDSFLKAK